MLKLTPDNLRDEIKAATELRDKFLDHTKKLIERYHGRFYRSDRETDQPVPENHAYEYVSIMLPSLIYDNPRCNVSCARPTVAETSAQQKVMAAMEGAGVMSIEDLAVVMGSRDLRGLYKAIGVQTMGDVADGIEASLNRWSEDCEVADPLGEIAMDFFFRYAVAMVVSGDQPGYQGGELVPQQPYICAVAPHHFFMDNQAMNPNPMSNGGPRLMGHLWRADQEDLMEDERFDKAEIAALGVDTDLEAHGDSGWITPPARREIVAWDVWVPEKNLTSEPGYNGSIYTVAVCNTRDGVSKKPRFLRKPVPAFCPPWGPYIVFGAYRVPGSPYPLSPLAATAEQAEEVNTHVAAASRDAMNYKRFAYGPSVNGADGERIRRVQHGEYVGLDESEKVGQMELGGVSQGQYEYIADARGRLDRRSGLTEAKRGTVGKGTATAESIANAGSETRLAGLKRAYRRGVAKVFKSAAWHMFYGEEQQHYVGDESSLPGDTFNGGLTEETAHFNFFDLSLNIEPLSMEHTDQAMLQQRMAAAFDRLVEVAPLIMQYPYVQWRKPVRALFQSLNVPEADEWIDFDMIEEAAEAQQEAQATGAAPMPGNEPGMEQADTAAQMGNAAGQAAQGVAA